jgi:hypothetical protein
MIPLLRRCPATRSLEAITLLALIAACATPQPAPKSDSAKAIGEAAAKAAADAGSGTPQAGLADPPRAPGARTPPPAAAVAAAAAATAATQAAQRERPFAEVTKDAKEAQGLFRIWTRRAHLDRDRTDQFDKPYFLTSNLNQGIGESRLFGGMMTYPSDSRRSSNSAKVGSLVR